MALTKVTYPDSEKILLGTGDDLEIYFDNTHSRIVHTPATGDLVIQSDDIYLTDGAGSEYYFRGTKDGAAELYYDNSKKFETTSYGSASAGQVRITSSNATTVGFSCGDAGTGFYNSGSNAIGYSANGTQKWNIDSGGSLHLVDDVKLNLGTGDDLQIYHDASNSYIQNANNATTLIAKSDYFHVDENQTGDHMLRCRLGVVELYHNGVKTFETGTGGATLYGIEGGEARFFLYADEGDDNADKWRVEADTAGNFNIHNLADGSWDRSIACAGSGNVELFYDDSKKFETLTSGVKITGALTFTDTGQAISLHDDRKLHVGSGDDMEIFHDGTNTMIDNNTGDLKISSSGALRLRGDQVSLQNEAQTEAFMHCNVNSSVDIYHDNVKVFETTSNGFKVLGPEGGMAELLMYADEGDDADDKFRVVVDNSAPDFYIQNYKNGSSWENSLRLVADGGAHLYYNNVLRLETTDEGVKCTGGDLRMPTGKLIRCGDSTYGDIKIYRDASLNYFDTDNANLHIRVGGSEKAIVCVPNGDVNLYYNDLLRMHTTTGGIYVTGSVTESSDIALKTNITPIDNALDKIKQLKGYTYKIKATELDSVGVIAQEVEKVFPQLVHGEEGSKGVDYSGLIGALIESVKELSAKVSALEAK